MSSKYLFKFLNPQIAFIQIQTDILFLRNLPMLVSCCKLNVFHKQA